MPRLGEVLWIVDLNRQSLDRVVPDIAAGRIGAMFEAAGWQTITVKYGRRLRELFARDGGEALRDRIDAMTNEEYQRLLRSTPTELRERLPGDGPRRRERRELIADLDDDELRRAIRDLGGHDLGDLLDAFAEADAVTDRPSVIFAYTIKAWRLPTQGHPGQPLGAAHGRAVGAARRRRSAPTPPIRGRRFEPGTPEAELCARDGRAAAARAGRAAAGARRCPRTSAARHAGRASTQQAFGRFFVDLAHAAPEVAARVVTVSPDVASSTNLGGWINRVGVWNLGERIDWFADDTDTLVRWRETEHGQHIELGIAEGNLVGLLGELGLTWSRDGQPLLPIGTIYDPFVNRALEPWSFGMYAGGQSILVGTPSGVTLAPEGGAHQSIITPSVGLEQPRCIAWEPAFGQDLEWTLLHALSRLGRPDGDVVVLPPDAPARSTRRSPRCRTTRRGARAPAPAGAAPAATSCARRRAAPRVTLVGVGAIAARGARRRRRARRGRHRRPTSSA